MNITTIPQESRFLERANSRFTSTTIGVRYCISARQMSRRAEPIRGCTESYPVRSVSSFGVLKKARAKASFSRSTISRQTQNYSGRREHGTRVKTIARPATSDMRANKRESSPSEEKHVTRRARRGVTVV